MRTLDTQRPRKKRRASTAGAGCRSARRFASAFAALEPRSLPSVVAAVGVPAAVASDGSTADFIGPRPYQAPPPSDAVAHGPTTPGFPRPPHPWPGWEVDHPAGPEGHRPGWATPVPLEHGTPAAMGIDHGGARMAMAEANILINGVPTAEFAFADESTGRISVIVGGQRKFSFAIAPGPAAVKLADLNGDTHPELIVADSGDDVVLVFLGQDGGGFGSGPDRLRRFTAGTGPAGITIGDAEGNAASPPDLVIANKGSDNVTILLGQGQGQGWTMVPGPTPLQLPAGSAPVRTALADVNRDGNPDLFVLNSGSNDVYLYRGQGGGTFDFGRPSILPVGQAPDEMFVGRFDHHPGLDLVTVNSGSNDLTFVSSVASFTPTTLTYSSGGLQPDAAVAVDVAHDGTLDLVVANGDGRLALLQPAEIGLRLAGVIRRDDLPSPTAVAPGTLGGGTLEFYAATAGLDAAAILRFDIGQASAYLAVPLDAGDSTNAGDDELLARLLPFGDSALDLIAVLWNGSDESSEDWASRSPSPTTVYYLKGEGQGDVGPGPPDRAAATDPEDAGPLPLAISPDDPNSWARFVLGSEDALGRPSGVIDAVAARDAGEAPVEGPTGADRRPGDLDARAVDDALRSLWSDGSGRPSTGPGSTDGIVPAPGAALDSPRTSEAQAIDDARSEMVPVISSTLFAARLILKASPPRPPSFRRGAATRPMATGPVGGRPPRL